MRVIGGEFRSRKLISVPGLATRPTPDRLRESLFNILAPQIEGVVFLDAYAGTGAVGIEALSRGASHAIFIERNRAAMEAIRQNLTSLGILKRATLATSYVLKTLTQQKADIVFLDPPYDLEREYGAALDLLGQTPPELTIVQHSSHFALADRYGDLERYRHVKQGENVLSFYRATADTPVPPTGDA